MKYKGSKGRRKLAGKENRGDHFRKGLASSSMPISRQVKQGKEADEEYDNE